MNEITGRTRLSDCRRLQMLPGSTVRAPLPVNGDFAATHLSPDPPRSPASRLLRTLRRRLQTFRSPEFAGVARINCRSALAREGDGAAAHLSSDPPRSPASRLLRTLRRRLQTLRSPEFAGVARINVGARLPANGDLAAAHLSPDPPRSPASRLLRTLRFASKPAPADFAFAEGCRCCPDQL
jgi:hypothetical protein